MTDRELWIWITAAFGPSNTRKWEVMTGFSEISEFYTAFMRGNVKGLSKEESDRMRSITRDKISDIMNYCSSKGINIYCYDDEEFPKRLRDIYNPPSVLFCYGRLQGIDSEVLLSVAGARELTEYSLKAEKEIVSDLVKSGVVIVSGIQVGADREASMEAINRRAKTYAVLGCGLEYEYPKGSKELYRKISENGAVITEYFPNHKPRTRDFHYRNRLISALSLGTFIIQATPKSGSLSIAEFALHQGKDIFTLSPHDIFEDTYKGNIMLLRDGAIPVFEAQDILNEYKNNYSHRLTFSKRFTDEYSLSKKKPFEKDRTKVKAAPSANSLRENKENEPKHEFSDLGETAVKIINLIKSGTDSVDDIANSLGEDVSAVTLELTELEIMGAVISLPGRRYKLN